MLLKNLIKISNKLDEMGKFEHADKFDDFSDFISEEPIEGVITEVYDEGCVGKNEDEHDEHGQSYMTLPLLKKIRDLSSELCKMINEGEQVEDWIESYISQMSKMMDDVYTAWKYNYDK